MTKKQWHKETLAVRGGLERSSFQETSEALYLNSGYVYDTAEEAAAAFDVEFDRERECDRERDLGDLDPDIDNGDAAPDCA